MAEKKFLLGFSIGYTILIIIFRLVTAIPGVEVLKFSEIYFWAFLASGVFFMIVSVTLIFWELHMQNKERQIHQIRKQLEQSQNRE